MLPTTWIGRRRNALLEAAGLLEDLGIDQTRPVDIFGTIDQLDLWLTFVPLGDVLGACLPVGHGGIMITTQRQPQVQRYTAAHEIGHWILDHGHAWFDDEEAILRTSAPERERLAQLFAAYFIMPPPLIHATAGHYGLEAGGPIEPQQAYLVARDMGVSYEAAVRQMAELDFVSSSGRDQLLSVSPLAAKSALAHGTRPVIGNADVWPIDEHWDGAHLDVTVQDEIVIALPENRTTGYRWMTPADVVARDARHPQPAPPAFATGATADGTAARPPKPASHPTAGRGEAVASTVAEVGPLVTVGDHYAPGGPTRTTRQARADRRLLAAGQPMDAQPRGIGATGRRWLSLQAQAEGTWRFELTYAAAHEPFASPVAAFGVEATVRPTPAIAHSRILLRAVPGEDPSGPSSTAS